MMKVETAILDTDLQNVHGPLPSMAANVLQHDSVPNSRPSNQYDCADAAKQYYSLCELTSA